MADMKRFIEINEGRCMAMARYIENGETKTSEKILALGGYTFLKNMGDNRFNLFSVDPINYTTQCVEVQPAVLNPELLAYFE